MPTGGVDLQTAPEFLQAGCAAGIGAAFGIFRGPAAAQSGLIGGFIVAIGTALFGWRLFAPGIAPAAHVRRALFAAEWLIWFWMLIAVWAALTQLRALPLPLMTGLSLAQFGHWAALSGKRGKMNGSV